MVEIENKYKIYKRKFGYVNWIGLWTLYKKEVLRFLIVIIQTVISPLVTSLLFLLVLSLAIGNERGEVLGVPFITFLAPGLIAMQVIQQAFSHSSSSIMIGKIQGNIVDILYAPLTAAEITIAKNADLVFVITNAVKNVRPLVDLRSVRKSGGTYQIPIPISQIRQESLAISWIVGVARNRPEKSIEIKLAKEFIEANSSRGNSIKKRDALHKIGQSNKAFAHFHW